jgi:hypothetical protein
MDSTLAMVWNPSGNSMDSIRHSMDSIWNNPGKVKYCIPCILQIMKMCLKWNKMIRLIFFSSIVHMIIVKEH